MPNDLFKKSAVAIGVAAAVASGSSAIADDYTSGALRATVQDQAGKAVSNATVVVTSNKGERRVTTSDQNGKILVPQLPIGRYSITVDGAGYEQLKSSDVVVSIGGGGASYTFTLESRAQTIEEVYVTGVRQGDWDFNATQTGLSLDVQETFNMTPVGRSADSLLLLAPGTTYSGEFGAVSISGSSAGENQYYINGLNVSNFRTYVGASTLPFEFYDQLEIKTGGYQAEFGRSTGGVTNAVTRSGSNEFQAGINAYYSPNGLKEQSPSTYSSANHLDKSDSTDMNIWASGALIQDKLFFFALYNPGKSEGFGCGGGVCSQVVSDDPFWGGKLDWVIADGHRLEFTYFEDYNKAEIASWNYNDTAAALLGDEKEVAKTELADAKDEQRPNAYSESGGVNTIWKYTGVLTDWFSISALYGENNYSRQYYGENDSPYLIDYTTNQNIAIGDWSASAFALNDDRRVAKRIDADFYFEALGDHHVRVGWDQEKLTATEDTSYSGDLRGRLEKSASSATGYRWQIREYYNVGGFKTEQSAWYIQDSWQISDTFLLNIGVRNETFENSNVDGQVFIETKDQTGVRAGFSWDPTGNATTRVFGSYGRYFLPIATNTNVRLAGKEIYWRQYYTALDVDGDGVYGDLDADGYPILGDPTSGRTNFADGTLGFQNAQRASGIEPMYQDEYILGVEHSFDSGWTASISFTDRDLVSTIEDVAIDAAVIAWANENGYEDDPALSTYTGFHQYVLVNPGSASTISLLEDFGDDGVEDVVNFSAEDLGYPEAQRTYKGTTLTLEKEYDGKWGLSLNYTYSKSEGNYEGSVKSDNGQDDAGLTQDFDQPGLVDGSYGYLPNDRRHRLTMTGVYAVNDNLMLTAKFRSQSERVFGCIGEHPSDYFAWAYAAASWYCQNELTPRGSQLSSDWINTLDLGLVFKPTVGSLDGDLTLRVDVFNVLNADNRADLYEFGDVGYTGYAVFGIDNLPDADPNYGKTTRFQSPRSVRLGVSYNF